MREINLGGHMLDSDEAGRPLLIDTHDRKVADHIWALYRSTIARTGPLPTQFEWDADIPTWDVLHQEMRSLSKHAR